MSVVKCTRPMSNSPQDSHLFVENSLRVTVSLLQCMKAEWSHLLLLIQFPHML